MSALQALQNATLSPGRCPGLSNLGPLGLSDGPARYDDGMTTAVLIAQVALGMTLPELHVQAAFAAFGAERAVVSLGHAGGPKRRIAYVDKSGIGVYQRSLEGMLCLGIVDEDSHVFVNYRKGDTRTLESSEVHLPAPIQMTQFRLYKGLIVALPGKVIWNEPSKEIVGACFSADMKLGILTGGWRKAQIHTYSGREWTTRALSFPDGVSLNGLAPGPEAETFFVSSISGGKAWLWRVAKGNSELEPLEVRRISEKMYPSCIGEGPPGALCAFANGTRLIWTVHESAWIYEVLDGGVNLGSGKPITYVEHPPRE